MSTRPVGYHGFHRGHDAGHLRIHTEVVGPLAPAPGQGKDYSLPRPGVAN